MQSPQQVDYHVNILSKRKRRTISEGRHACVKNCDYDAFLCLFFTFLLIYLNVAHLILFYFILLYFFCFKCNATSVSSCQWLFVMLHLILSSGSVSFSYLVPARCEW